MRKRARKMGYNIRVRLGYYYYGPNGALMINVDVLEF